MLTKTEKTKETLVGVCLNQVQDALDQKKWVRVKVNGIGGASVH